MSAKEISVFFIGLLLVAFLYVMKNPTVHTTKQFSIDHSPTIGINPIVNNNNNNFNPKTNSPVFENILDIPAWEIDIESLKSRTSEEILTAIDNAINQDQLFSPENDNVLFYLLNLKAIDDTNEKIASIQNLLTQELLTQSQDAIKQSNDNRLKDYIAKIKTLDANNQDISKLEKQLAQIKTINGLYKKGKSYIHDNNIISKNSIDAWHIAKQAIAIDKNNTKAQEIVNKVNDILIKNGLRAAEEIDFNLASEQINQAALLAPESQKVISAQDQIDQLKQQRYVWLEQQIAQAIDATNIARTKKMLAGLSDLGLQKSQLSEYQSELTRMVTYGSYKPLEIFNDNTTNGTQLPNMVVMPTGGFIMGSTQKSKHERPQHMVTIKYGFAVSQNEISVQDFRDFIKDSNYITDAEKNNTSKIYDLRTGRLKNKNRINWQRNYIGKKARDNDPVIHISWDDAFTYTQWISQQTGKNYRLLSESEFEYILRAGSRTKYPWGDGTPKQIIENLTGKLDRIKGNSRIRWKKGFEKYNDKHWGPAPVGSFINNPFKLNDTAGNIMEWVADCWHDSYIRAPINGKSWINAGCENHVIRGGSWSSSKNEFTSSHRFTARSNFTDARLGFRIALDLSE